MADAPRCGENELHILQHALGVDACGTTYRVIGVGKMQAKGWTRSVLTDRRIWMVEEQVTADMADVVTYQCLEDGQLWVRPLAEFEDGRFEDVPAPEGPAAARSSSTEAALVIARKALEEIATDEPHRASWCQTDVEYEPALSAEEAFHVAGSALARIAALAPFLPGKEEGRG